MEAQLKRAEQAYAGGQTGDRSQLDPKGGGSSPWSVWQGQLKNDAYLACVSEGLLHRWTECPGQGAGSHEHGTASAPETAPFVPIEGSQIPRSGARL
jgi:hypothetical protein